MCVEASKKRVCVLDASGELGQSLVHRLLQRGYTVHAALYNNHNNNYCSTNESESSSSSSTSSWSGLKVFRWDPLDYGSIANAVRGCSGLFCLFDTPRSHHHSTSPTPHDHQELMVEVEVRAAQNVVEACAQTETMRRVVFTSSVTAVVWRENHNTVDAFDENNWSDLSFCRKFKLWHALAKTLSEKTAWALAMDRGVDMVAINAGLMTGAGLTAAHPYLKGAPDMYDHGVLVTVGVDFLADAHVAVYEAPSAYGRYLCFDHAVCRPEDALRLAQMLSPSAPPSSPCDELKVIPQRIQSNKLNKLMLEFAGGMCGQPD